MFIPFPNRFLRLQFEDRCIESRKKEEADFHSEKTAQIAFLGFGPEQQNSADDHDNEAGQRVGHDLLVYLRYGLMPHCQTEQPQVKPHQQTNGYRQSQDMGRFHDRKRPKRFSNTRAKIAVLHPMDDGGNF